MHVQIFIENEGWDRSTGPTAFDYHLKVVKSKIGKDNLVLCNGYDAHNLVLCNGYDAYIFINLQKSFWTCRILSTRQTCDPSSGNTYYILPVPIERAPLVRHYVGWTIGNISSTRYCMKTCLCIPALKCILYCVQISEYLHSLLMNS